MGRPRRLPKPDGTRSSKGRQRSHLSSSGRSKSVLEKDAHDPPGCSDASESSSNQSLPLSWGRDLSWSVAPLFDIHKLAAEYQLNVHPFLPILPADSVRLLATLQSAPSLLFSSINFVTFPTDAPLPMPEIQPTLPDIQAAIFLTHAHYGRGDTTNARIMLQNASKCLLDLKWHLIDAGASNVTTETMPEDEFEPIRRIWWESWSLEIMMAAVTGVRAFILSTEIFFVNLPREQQGHLYTASEV
jgi:hypothetical protein